MRHFPAFFDLDDRPVVVVGAGAVALRKIRLLLRAGARITVIAPRANADVAVLAQTGALVWQARAFEPGDVAGAALVFGATDDVAVNRAVSETAQAAGIPVAIVDSPKLSTFITPAIVDRDPITVAIASGGASPVLARRIRARIEALLPARLGVLARFAESFRASVAAVRPGFAARRRWWEDFFEGPLAARVLAGDEQGARRAFVATLNRTAPHAEGRVALVGAGPGDPDLLTLRALQRLQDADAVVHDRLGTGRALDYARRDADFIPVGKAPGHKGATQDGINALLLSLAREGKRVVRLKGGDPFIFGRGGEELEFLRAHGIDVEIVPGITAATGAAATAGVPLTHRGMARAVTFVTAATADGIDAIDWAALAQLGQTLVVYMGVAAAGDIAQRLIAHGMDSATPIAAVENATSPDQRILTGRLGNLAAQMRQHGVQNPAVIVIGEVAAFAEEAASVARFAAAS
jgi:uroporphyrin-III C-methyltransferase / precorrin-2 dehydrogenase / sirohydrochlorin ferrochelatase